MSSSHARPAGTMVPAPPAGASLAGDLAGGLAAAIVSIAFALSFGVLAFASLGPAFLSVGVTAGFAAVLYGQLIGGLVGGTAHPGSVPRASASLLLASLVATLVQDPLVAPSATQGPERIVALAGACVALSGVLQVIIAWLRLSQFARYVPFPFVAGFMCGIAVLVLISQVAPLTGVEPATLHRPAAAWQQFHIATLIVGIVTGGAYLVAQRKAERWPAVLVGLLAGCATHYLFAALVTQSSPGPVVGAIPSALPLPTALLPLASLSPADLWRWLPAVAASALLIATFGTLDGLFSAVAIDQATEGRHDPRREVLAHGLANIASGLFGGLPVVFSAARSLASYHAGGRTRRTVVIAVAALAFMLVVGTGLIAKVPVAVLAGIIMVTSIGLVDRWVRGLVIRLPQHARDPARALSLATVAIVAAMTVVFGFLPALVTGLALSVLLLMIEMNRSLIRSVVTGTERPSRRVWGGADADRVREARERVRVIELEGPLFFGSAERLVEEVETMRGDVDVVVLDFRLVTSIDATAALLVERLTRRLGRRSMQLVLAGVTRGGRLGEALLSHATFADAEDRAWFRDADKALEWAERAALARAGRVKDAELAPMRIPLFRNLSHEELAIVMPLLVRHEVRRGQVLFREGDEGSSLFMIARGAIEISVMGAEARRTRLVTMASGSLFGEVALLDGKPRSATAAAAEDSVLYELSRKALFGELEDRHPTIVIMLLATLSIELSNRLRETTGLVRRMDDARG